MKQYINKSAVVAEIERIKKEECPTDSYEGRCKLLWFEQFLSFIDSLETKEVDLEKEIIRVSKNKYFDFTDWKSIARHFFELGLKAKDVNEIIKTAEDHAYFAGSENTRKKLIDKACEWLRKGGSGWYLTPEYGEDEIDFVKLAEDFRKAMEE